MSLLHRCENGKISTILSPGAVISLYKKWHIQFCIPHRKLFFPYCLSDIDVLIEYLYL